jgi:hypothetical protein
MPLFTPLLKTPKTFLKANVRPIKLPLGTNLVGGISKGCVFLNNRG